MSRRTVAAVPRAVSGNRRPTAETLAACLVLLSIGGLGLMRSPGLWFDEAYSGAMARLSWGDLVRAVSYQEVNNAGYYAVLHLWTTASQSDMWSRMLSLLATVVTVPVLASLASVLGGRRAVRVSLLAYVSFASVWSLAVEARGYALAALMATVLVRAYVGVRRSRSARRIGAVLVLSGCLMVLTNLLSLLLVVVLAAHALGTRSAARSIGWLAAPGLAGAGMWLLAAQADRGQVSWLPPVSPAYLAIVARQVVGSGAGVLLLVAVGVVLFGVALTVVRSGRGDAGRIASGDIGLALGWGLAVPAAIVAISLGKPVLQGRYLLFCVPGIALSLGLVAAWAAEHLELGARTAKRRARLVRAVPVAGLVGILVCNAAGAVEESPWRRPEDLSQAAAFIGAHAQPGDVVDVVTSGLDVPVGFVLRRQTAASLPIVSSYDERMPRLDDPPVTVSVYRSRLPGTGGRIWTIERTPCGTAGTGQGELDAARRTASTRRQALLEGCFGSVQVHLYEIA
ncbi:hypothetical protein K8Z61_10410 [Nocardioides sp. TRM66260-LWL]|uniref:hypothetical protein n=1 Tax=Nocardioides sp. TRM66260-LWL TaxID=2874478 RepID=UPI001CC5C8B2|nr:hypothetical protein [Nocardioides sp. TRM66260-LWL]MBZ5734908.1 hypothetical protein [Nocardioides sp. TRM66260-LWL]